MSIFYGKQFLPLCLNWKPNEDKETLSFLTPSFSFKILQIDPHVNYKFVERIWVKWYMAPAKKPDMSWEEKMCPFVLRWSKSCFICLKNKSPNLLLLCCIKKNCALRFWFNLTLVNVFMLTPLVFFPYFPTSLRQSVVSPRLFAVM